MSKFWQKKYISKYTGAEIDAAVAKAGDATKVTANPTLAGTEAALTGLEVGDTKYKVEQPINVVANPTLAGTEAALEGLQVGNTKYKVEQPVSVAAYPINCSVLLDGSTIKFLCEKTFADATALDAFLDDSAADYFQKGFFNFAVTVTSSALPSDIPVGYKFIAFATALDPDEGFISQVNTYLSGVLATTYTNTYDSTFGFRFDVNG